MGESGFLHIRLRGSMVQTLDLYAEITDNELGAMSAKFLKLPPEVAELLQQLAFLKHRKQVAGTRKSLNK
mgnify:FL=1